MTNLAIGIILGLLIGLPLGVQWTWVAIRSALLSGRLTVRDIADQCDRLIDAADEPTEPAPTRQPRCL